jgi:hypothetical protein
VRVCFGLNLIPPVAVELSLPLLLDDVAAVLPVSFLHVSAKLLCSLLIDPANLRSLSTTLHCFGIWWSMVSQSLYDTKQSLVLYIGERKRGTKISRS